MQPGDLYQTYAEVEDLFEVTGYKPAISVSEGEKISLSGIKSFITD